MTVPSNSETIERYRGGEEALRSTLAFLDEAKWVNVCGDSLAPSLIMEVEPIRKCYEALKRRDVKVRLLTEITKDNLSYCKALMEYVELYHLNGIKGNFWVSDEGYITITANSNFSSSSFSSSLDKAGQGPELLYCRAKNIIQQNNDVFDTLCSKGVLAQERIKEIEEGVIHSTIRTVKDPKEIIQENIALIKHSSQYSFCSSSEQLLSTQKYTTDVFREILELQKHGKHAGIRWLIQSESKKDNRLLDVIRTLTELGVEIRYIQSKPTVIFGISDREIAITIENGQQRSSSAGAIFSTNPSIVGHFATIFEDLWDSALDAKEMIMEVEREPEMFIDIIHNPEEIQKSYHTLVASARHQVLLFLPTATAYIREEKIGIFDSLEQAADRGANIRILLPTDKEIEEKIKHKIKLKRGFEIRKIKTGISAQARSKILIVDSNTYLTIELKDNSKETFIEAVGSAIISNSKSTVLSYLTMFDSLWSQAELYEKLEAQGKMQKEFINIAAHELRTPTQAILGYSELLQNESGEQADDMLKSLTRNAYRLQSLISDILDVARIEAGTFIIEMENTNLTDLITSAIADAKNQVKLSGRRIEISYSQKKLEEAEGKKDLFVTVDKDRILQVISNLLGNAVKFTREGNISVTTEKTDQEVLVKVKDSGSGIDKEILPKLFEKFASKSDKGTGLGLFISKNIIEAHGGRISAENNPDGMGATFGFTLRI